MIGNEQVEIVRFEDRFAADFARLNREWLEGFGLLEATDLMYLDHPRESIIDHGGEILFAISDDRVIGSCAIVRIDSTTVELAKLSVAPEARGRGIGRRITVAAIAHAHALGAKRIVLLSNHQLAPAIRLYETLGFQHAPLPASTGYATADVHMELSLTDKIKECAERAE
jgi:ribosomal protein S18 acetylase RimI-like enzyme